MTFSDQSVGAGFSPRDKDWDTEEYALGIVVKCRHLDWQVSTVAQISNSLGQILSVVNCLVLQHRVHNESSEEHNEVDRAEWRKLLRPFRNVKTLRIQNGLVKDLSRCLGSEDGELPFGLLPELYELEYYESGNTGDVFSSFIDARRNAGRPVILVRR